MMLFLFFLLLVSQVCLSSSVFKQQQYNEKQVKWLKRDHLEALNEVKEPLMAHVDQKEVCEICKENFELFQGHRLGCNHPFHEHCIRDWLNDSQDFPRGCPICSARPVLVKESGKKDMIQFMLDQHQEMWQVMRDLWGFVGSMNGLRGY